MTILQPVIVSIPDINTFKSKVLEWASAFNVACYLDSNSFKDPYSKYDALIAVGVKHELKASVGTAFAELEQFRNEHTGWMTGFFTYDLKNELEGLTSANPDHLQFPDLYFFVPKHLITIKGNEAEIRSANAGEIFEAINRIELPTGIASPIVKLQPRFTRAYYVSSVEQIKVHIIRGDIYVSNFCQEFYAEGTAIDPLTIFNLLNGVSPNPFSCFFKYYDQYILCASPERFLAKRGSKLISQPIKGTAKREADKLLDESVKHQLQTNPKEQQENVMIVDLVRNDLTLSAKPGTVKTEELFGIYSFTQLHQLISTVVCELNEEVSVIGAIKNTFPMGSMTGAPKISAMQLMEHYEKSKRGMYSGAIGYFDPDNDFDFNVIIRSLLYNSKNKYLSLHVGSAITHQADPEKEYEECLVKASAIFKVLGNNDQGNRV